MSLFFVWEDCCGAFKDKNISVKLFILVLDEFDPCIIGLGWHGETFDTNFLDSLMILNE